MTRAGYPPAPLGAARCPAGAGAGPLPGRTEALRARAPEVTPATRPAPRRRRRAKGWLPVEPLMLLVQARLRQVPQAVLARQLGVTERTLRRLAVRGRLRSDSADRLAVALGHHPSEIWSEWFPLESSNE